MSVGIKRKGISLIELVLVLALIGILIQGIYSVFFIGSKSYNTSKDLGFAQQEIRNLSMTLTSELRSAREIGLSIPDSKFIKVESVEGKYFINVNEKLFGPFLETHIIVDNVEGKFSLSVSSFDFPNIADSIEFRFENWPSFLDKSQYVDENGNPIEISLINYTKYE